MATAPQIVTIDDIRYHLDDLSANTKNQMASLRFADLEITRLQRQLAVAQTARAAYAAAIQVSLKDVTPAA